MNKIHPELENDDFYYTMLENEDNVNNFSDVLAENAVGISGCNVTINFQGCKNVYNKSTDNRIVMELCTNTSGCTNPNNCCGVTSYVTIDLNENDYYTGFITVNTCALLIQLYPGVGFIYLESYDKGELLNTCTVLNRNDNNDQFIIQNYPPVPNTSPFNPLPTVQSSGSTTTTYVFQVNTQLDEPTIQQAITGQGTDPLTNFIDISFTFENESGAKLTIIKTLPINTQNPQQLFSFEFPNNFLTSPITYTYQMFVHTSKLIGTTMVSNITPSSVSKKQTFYPNLPCFVKGTQILCKQGYTRVEDLKKGDWILHNGRIYDDDKFKADNCNTFTKIVEIVKTHKKCDSKLTQPICIRKGTYDQYVPMNDLYVSPDHGIIINNKLVPAKELINHKTIYQCKTMASVYYYHIKLEHHSAIFAENVITESFRDTHKEIDFSNWKHLYKNKLRKQLASIQFH
jgi:hypothetical protein